MPGKSKKHKKTKKKGNEQRAHSPREVPNVEHARAAAISLPSDDVEVPATSPEMPKLAARERESPPVSRFTRRRIKARIRARKVYRALYAIAGAALGLIWFWPKVNLSMEPRDDAVVWLYTVRNDSLLPISDVTKENDVQLKIRPCIDMEKTVWSIGPEAKSACGPEEKVPELRPGDAHTFKCLVPTAIPPTDQIGGSVQLRVQYRYLRIFPMSTTACFEYAPKADGLPRYLRRACSTPARTLPSPPC